MDWYQVATLSIAVLIREFAVTIRNVWGARQKTKDVLLTAKIQEAVEQRVQWELGR